jgi:sensitive to high expression protein 9
MRRIISSISSLVNLISGYDQVLVKKGLVAEKDMILKQSKANLKLSKMNYTNHFENRVKTQKEIHSLLQRQSSWSSADLVHFTNLYKRDLDLDQSLVKLKLDLDEASESFDLAHSDYLNELRERYATECLVSDKVKSLSNLFTIGLLTFHISLFLFVQLYLEPRKKADLLEQLESSFKIEILPSTVKTVEKSTLTDPYPSGSETLYEYLFRIIRTWTLKLFNFLHLSAARIKNKIPVIS